MHDELSFTLNGEPVTVSIGPLTTAAQVLREQLELTGTKIGCGEGECGACTILVDDQAVASCILPAAVLAGRRVVTIEGLAAADGTLHPVQQAFVEAGAIQCGFCSPGMIMRTVSFLQQCPQPSDQEIARSIEGNLCRCTGYIKILQAIRNASQGRAG
jgi:carbon-monoxide dehydrogenase small subunit